MMELLPRERVELALSHQDTDRVPTDFWAVPEVWEKLFKKFGTRDENQVLERLDIDMRTIGPDYAGPKMEIFSDGSYLCPDGTHRRTVKNQYGAYEEYASYPLAGAQTLEEVDAFRWPKAEWYDMDGFARKIGGLHDRYFIKVDTTGMYENAWALRGMENFMVDMAMEEEIPHRIMEHLTNYNIEKITRILEKAGDKIDLVYTYDDIASQNGPLMSKAMWEEYIKPYHARLNRAIKNFGKKIMYHSCGAVYSFIEDLIGLPIDILNPLQPKAEGMDLQKIKDNFGDRLSFHGAIDIQQLLPFGTPEEVEEAAVETKRILGAKGGYIMTSAHYIQADTPVENILALFAAANK